MRMNGLAVLLSLFSPFLAFSALAAVSHPITAVPDFNCVDSESVCFEKAHQAIHDGWVGLDMFSGVKPNLYGPSDYWGQCEYTEFNRKTKLIAVLMHGLYEDGRQLAPEAVWLTEQGIPALNIVLAGHGSTNGLATEITYQDYIADAERALKLAIAMGDRVILVGHSTGGALSAYLGIKYPKAIAGVVLIEPAIRVAPVVESAACVAQHEIPDIAAHPTLLKIYGANPKALRNRIISPSAGCEVHKLRNAILSIVPEERWGDGELAHSRAMGHELTVPLLMLNNVNDQVVDSANNDAFAEGAKVHAHTTVFHFNADKKLPHGSISFSRPDIIQSELSKFMASEGLFYRDPFPNSF